MRELLYVKRPISQTQPVDPGWIPNKPTIKRERDLSDNLGNLNTDWMFEDIKELFRCANGIKVILKRVLILYRNTLKFL